MASQNTEDVVESLDFENMQTVADDITELSRSDSVEDKIDFSVKSWREDMALVVESKKLYVASNVLSLMSPVFTTMFEEQLKEDCPKEIELHGKKFDEMAEFLRCLYPNILKNITQDNVFIVLPLADEFKVDRMKLECENVLLKATTAQTLPENIYKCLEQAYHYKLDNLRLKVLDIAANLDQRKPGVTEGRLKLSLEVQIEIQNKQMETLNGTVSKLTIENNTMLEKCQNLKDCVKHFWPDYLMKAEHHQCDVGVLLLTLPDVKTFEKPVLGTWMHIYGIRWSVYAQRQRVNDEETLAVYLRANVPVNWTTWTCEASYKILLISQNEENNYERKAKCAKSTYTQDQPSWGNKDFIKMQQLSDDKYVKDGSALIKAYLVVKQPWCKPEF